MFLCRNTCHIPTCVKIESSAERPKWRLVPRGMFMFSISNKNIGRLGSESVAYFTEKWPHMRDVDCRRYATCADRAAEVSPDELRPDFQEAGQENS